VANVGALVSTNSAVQRCVVEDWLPPPMVNGTASRRHWAFYYRSSKSAQKTVWATAKHAGWVKIQTKAHLTITLIFPQKRRRDTDNLYARCKSLIDGLKDFIVDDSTDWLELEVRERVEPKRKATELILSEVQPTSNPIQE
jgi:Holliday junction resolvase RusA-like endonuclease